MAIEVADREIELDEREVRVVGCLIEKELSTPDYYPMTINALTAACNQKTNREPVVRYSESDVAEAIESLQRKRLVGSASSSHGRAARYRHALVEMMGLGKPQLAVLSTLMLRGPETAGEVRGRTGRMYEFETLEDVDATLDDLAGGESPLVVELPRRPGQKEARYTHLFAGLPDHTVEPASPSGVEARVAALEEDLAALHEAVSDLSEAFRSFRKQFE